MSQIDIESRADLLSRRGKKPGFLVDYRDNVSLFIRAGIFEANDKIYKLDTDLVYTPAALPAAFAKYYVYLLNSSSVSAPSFTRSLTAPVWDPVRNGMYNGNDALVGVFNTKNSGTLSDIQNFRAKKISDGLVEIVYATDDYLLDNNVAPTGAWDTPTVNSDIFAHSNAEWLFIQLFNADAGQLQCAWLDEETAISENNPPSDSSYRFTSFNISFHTIWGMAGPSKRLRFWGEPDDNPTMTIRFSGERIRI